MYVHNLKKLLVLSVYFVRFMGDENKFAIWKRAGVLYGINSSPVFLYLSLVCDKTYLFIPINSMFLHCLRLYPHMAIWHDKMSSFKCSSFKIVK